MQQKENNDLKVDKKMELNGYKGYIVTGLVGLATGGSGGALVMTSTWGNDKPLYEYRLNTVETNQKGIISTLNTLDKNVQKLLIKEGLTPYDNETGK